MDARRTKGTLQVATATYTKDGRKVVLCGVMHIADPSFWDYVNSLTSAADAAGEEVQYEMVKNDLGRLVHLGPDLGPIAEAVGLQSQLHAMIFEDHWVCSDIPLSELLSSVPPEKLAKSEAESRKTSNSIMEMLEGQQRQVFAKLARRVLGYVHILGLLPIGAHGVKHSVIVGRRNQSAYEAIMGTSKNVTSVWGAAHLAGIGRMLRADGYKLVRKEWVTAMGKV